MLRRPGGPWLATLAGVLFIALYAVPLLRRWHVPSVVALVLGAAITSTLALPFTILVRSRCTRDYGLARLARPALLATMCTVSMVVAEVIVNESAASPPPGGLVIWALVATVIVWTGTFQYASDSQAATVERVSMVEQASHAVELVARCREALRDEALDGERRATIELTLASALLGLSSFSGHEDNFDEALTILDHAVAAGAPAPAFAAARQMVDGIRAKAQRAGDDVGWDRALSLLYDAARQVEGEAPEAPGVVLAARAARLEHLAANEYDPTRAERRHGAACQEFRRAIDATPHHLEEHALHTVELARIVGSHPLLGDLDGAIASSRRAARRLGRVNSEECSTAQLVLAELLEVRAAVAPQGGPGGVPDLRWPGRAQQRVVRLWPDRAGNDLARARARESDCPVGSIA